MESRHLNNYLFNDIPPRFPPKKLIENGFFIKASTLEELAQKCEIDVNGLISTVARFNEFAHKGETTYDNYYGDPSHKNPNLSTIEKGPYYAVRILPGELGTKDGFVTDEIGRVLKQNVPSRAFFNFDQVNIDFPYKATVWMIFDQQLKR